jgi:hypothetical protein
MYDSSNHNPIPIRQLIENVRTILCNETPVRWSVEQYRKTDIWGLFTQSHFKKCTDLNGESYPISVYTMIRDRGNGTPAFWKMIEWRDTSEDKCPNEIQHRSIMSEWQNQLSILFHKSHRPPPFRNFHQDSQFDHIRTISGQGMSRAAVRCDQGWLSDFQIPMDGEWWGMRSSKKDFERSIADFSLWGWKEMAEFIEQLPDSC